MTWQPSDVINFLRLASQNQSFNYKPAVPPQPTYTPAPTHKPPSQPINYNTIIRSSLAGPTKPLNYKVKIEEPFNPARPSMVPSPPPTLMSGTTQVNKQVIHAEETYVPGPQVVISTYPQNSAIIYDKSPHYAIATTYNKPEAQAVIAKEMQTDDQQESSHQASAVIKKPTMVKPIAPQKPKEEFGAAQRRMNQAYNNWRNNRYEDITKRNAFLRNKYEKDRAALEQRKQERTNQENASRARAAKAEYERQMKEFQKKKEEHEKKMKEYERQKRQYDKEMKEYEEQQAKSSQQTVYNSNTHSNNSSDDENDASTAISSSITYPTTSFTTTQKTRQIAQYNIREYNELNKILQDEGLPPLANTHHLPKYNEEFTMVVKDKVEVRYGWKDPETGEPRYTKKEIIPLKDIFEKRMPAETIKEEYKQYEVVAAACNAEGLPRLVENNDNHPERWAKFNEEFSIVVGNTVQVRYGWRNPTTNKAEYEIRKILSLPDIFQKHLPKEAFQDILEEKTADKNKEDSLLRSHDAHNLVKDDVEALNKPSIPSYTTEEFESYFPYEKESDKVESKKRNSLTEALQEENLIDLDNLHKENHVKFHQVGNQPGTGKSTEKPNTSSSNNNANQAQGQATASGGKNGAPAEATGTAPGASETISGAGSGKAEEDEKNLSDVEYEDAETYYQDNSNNNTGKNSDENDGWQSAEEDTNEKINKKKDDITAMIDNLQHSLEKDASTHPLVISRIIAGTGARNRTRTEGVTQIRDGIANGYFNNLDDNREEAYKYNYVGAVIIDRSNESILKDNNKKPFYEYNANRGLVNFIAVEQTLPSQETYEIYYDTKDAIKKLPLKEQEKYKDKMAEIEKNMPQIYFVEPINSSTTTTNDILNENSQSGQVRFLKEKAKMYNPWSDEVEKINRENQPVNLHYQDMLTSNKRFSEMRENIVQGRQSNIGSSSNNALVLYSDTGVLPIHVRPVHPTIYQLHLDRVGEMLCNRNIPPNELAKLDKELREYIKFLKKHHTVLRISDADYIMLAKDSDKPSEVIMKRYHSKQVEMKEYAEELNKVATNKIEIINPINDGKYIEYTKQKSRDYLTTNVLSTLIEKDSNNFDKILSNLSHYSEKSYQEKSSQKKELDEQIIPYQEASYQIISNMANTRQDQNKSFNERQPGYNASQQTWHNTWDWHNKSRTSTPTNNPWRSKADTDNNWRKPNTPSDQSRSPITSNNQLKSPFFEPTNSALPQYNKQDDDDQTSVTPRRRKDQTFNEINPGDRRSSEHQTNTFTQHHMGSSSSNWRQNIRQTQAPANNSYFTGSHWNTTRSTSTRSRGSNIRPRGRQPGRGMPPDESDNEV